MLLRRQTPSNVPRSLSLTFNVAISLESRKQWARISTIRLWFRFKVTSLCLKAAVRNEIFKFPNILDMNHHWHLLAPSSTSKQRKIWAILTQAGQDVIATQAGQDEDHLLYISMLPTKAIWLPSSFNSLIEGLRSGGTVSSPALWSFTIQDARTPQSVYLITSRQTWVWKQEN